MLKEIKKEQSGTQGMPGVGHLKDEEDGRVPATGEYLKLEYRVALQELWIWGQR